MKILSLGLDNSILNKSSALAQRAIEYGGLVEKYIVIVPNKKNEKIELSEKAMACGSGGNNKLWQFIKIYNLAKKLLREEKCDIITVQDQYYLALIGVRLSKKFKVGLEIQVHGFEKYYGLRRLTAKCVLLRANAVRCVSQRLKEQLVGQFGVKEERITVVPIYSEVKDLKQEKADRKNRDNDKFIFLTVGRLVKVKNISMQIEAMAEVVKKYPQTELWIVGDGPEKENLIRLGRIKLGDSIKFLGQKTKEDLNKIYSQADAFLLTSNYEGWGLAVIEAAGYSLPIIMTDVGCAGEVIKNNESGIVIPAGDKTLLVKAMGKTIQDKNLRLRLGEAARRAVAALPSEQETLNLYLMSWQKAAGQN